MRRQGLAPEPKTCYNRCSIASSSTGGTMLRQQPPTPLPLLLSLLRATKRWGVSSWRALEARKSQRKGGPCGKRFILPGVSSWATSAQPPGRSPRPTLDGNASDAVFSPRRSDMLWHISANIVNRFQSTKRWRITNLSAHAQWEHISLKCASSRIAPKGKSFQRFIFSK